MTLKSIANIIVIFVSLNLFSQESLYSSLTIPEDLTESANAVVRLNDIKVSLKSANEMYVTEKRIITILNKKGNDNVDAYVHYDNNVKIKNLQVLVYDNLGNEIKKIKKKRF